MNNKLKKYDLELFDAINEEMIRERNTLEMIASENFTSEYVLDIVGSVLTNNMQKGTLVEDIMVVVKL